jgi:hypothetical protein
MNRILMYLFSKTSFGKVIDGKKTVIGAVLVIVVAALEALEKLAPMFPQYPVLKDAAEGISGSLKGVQPILESLGVGFLTVGVVHKGVKAKLPSEK